jgi:hypothetical protein
MMRMTHHKRSLGGLRAVFAALALATSAFTSGCFIVVAGAAGAGTVAYIRGELDATVGGPYDRVIDASNRALDQVQFVKISERKDAFSAVIIARTAEDKRVRIRLTREGDRLTRVEIRIGVFGNEERSRAVLERIEAGL